LGWALVHLLLMQWKLQGSFVFVMVTMYVLLCLVYVEYCSIKLRTWCSI